MGLYRTPYGHGAFIDVTNNNMLFGYGGFELVTDTALIELAGSGGLTPNKFTIPGEVVRNLKFGFTQYNAATLAILYGGSNTASTGEAFIEGTESYTIDVGSTYTKTLAQTPTDAGAVWVASKDSDGNFDAVWAQGLAASAGVYTISSKTCVFAAADAAKTVYFYYMYTNATGTKTLIELDDAPSAIHLICVTEGATKGVSNTALQTVWDFQSVTLKAPASFNIPREGSNLIELEGGITGNIEVYTNG
jgi:hypothetical protein